MKRGELYRVRDPGHGDPKQFRAFVVVSRQALIESRFGRVICAPVYTNGHGLPSQVSIGIDEGMKHDSWICCDELVSLHKNELTYYVGSLDEQKTEQLNQALRVALSLDTGSFLLQ